MRTLSRYLCHFCLSLAIFGFFFLVIPALAQLYTGSLSGTVSDPAGAVVPQAKILLTDEAKGFTFSAISGADGHYVVRALPPGSYRVTVDAAGFSQFSRPGVVIAVGQNAEVNVPLHVGNSKQTIEVETAAPVLSTQDAATGQVINRQFINDLPLVGRSVFDLTQLAPGVSQAAGSSFGQNQNPVNFVSNGGRNSTSDILIDGVSTTNYENNSGVTNALYTPPVDAVQEFKLQQNNYTADIGFSGNTVVNVVLRSGSNHFHGSLYEFLENNDLNANNWFNNRSGVPIAPQRQNQFGGTAGGPIIKDRTFFFVDYQGTRSANSSTVTAGVPSAAERAGNFGEVCTHAGGVFDSAGMCSAAAGQLWDPYSGVYSASAGGAVRSQFIPFNNMATYISPGSPALVGSSYQPAPFAGNLIDPVAQKMMNYYPLPNLNVGAAGYNPLNNWIGQGGSSSNDDRFDIKVDHQFNEYNLLSARYSRDMHSGENVNCFGNVADPCTQGPNSGTGNAVAINFTHTFNPTTVLTVSYGFTRNLSNTRGVAADFPDFDPVTTLGMPGYITSSGYTATPAITVKGGYQQVGGNTSVGSQQYSILQYPLDTHDLVTSLDKIVGAHEFKFGWEGRMHRISFLQVGLPEGAYTYDFTGTSQLPSSGGGDAMASMLTGFGSSGSYQVPVAITTQNFQHGWYFQDNWRATSKLTLNLGVRYELTLPRTERYNRMSWLDPAAASPLQVPGLGPLKGGLEFASASERYPYDVNTANFAPRIGVAYRPLSKTVIRTGYGIFFDPIKGGASGTGGGGFTGFNWTTPQITTYQSDGATPFGRLSNPFPGGPQLPPGNSQGLLTGIGLGISGPIRYWNQTPYVQTWSFGVQQEMPGGVLVEANYVGTKGTHLYFGGAGETNYLPVSIESYSAAQIASLNAYVANPFYGVITNPSSSLKNATVQAYQLQRPYSQFTSFAGNDPPAANSIYNALQVRVEKRVSHGLQFLANYTWAKSIDDASVACGCTTWLGGRTSVQDPNRRYLERSVSQYDIPQILQFSYVYELPFGKGKHWGSNWNGFVNAVLGGWQTNGLWRFDNGMPIALGLNGSQSLPTYGTQRPNISSTLQRNNGADWLTQYFSNPQVVTKPAPFTIGNAPREVDTVRQPGSATAGLSVFKSFLVPPLGENARLEVRGEAFNALNHPQFCGPNTTANAGLFGQVTCQANKPRIMQVAMKFYW